MTTIAYRDGILAADTRVTEGDTITPEVARKVHRLESGALFGAAGNSEQCEEFLYAMQNSHPTPELKKIVALLVTPQGELFWYGGSRWSPTTAPYLTIGSGSDFALASMWWGKNAIEAVRCGMALDKNSGGTIYSVRLDDRSSRPRKPRAS